MNLQILLQSLEAAVGEYDIHRTVRAEEHQLRVVATTRKCGNQIESGGVPLMEIFKDQYQGSFGGNPLQGFANLPHHAFPSCAENFALQSLSVLGFHQRWKLDHPCGSTCRYG